MEAPYADGTDAAVGTSQGSWGGFGLLVDGPQAAGDLLPEECASPDAPDAAGGLSGRATKARGFGDSMDALRLSSMSAWPVAHGTSAPNMQK